MRFITVGFLRIISDFFENKSHLEIYTDGSSKNGVGSWAYVISRRGHGLKENSGRVPRANSNTMEFQAAIEALKSLPANSNVTLFTDSKVLVDSMKSRQGHASFQPQMDLLFPLTQKHTIQWRWIKAHNGNKFNERCDQLCTMIRGK